MYVNGLLQQFSFVPQVCVTKRVGGDLLLADLIDPQAAAFTAARVFPSLVRARRCTSTRRRSTTSWWTPSTRPRIATERSTPSSPFLRGCR